MLFFQKYGTVYAAWDINWGFKVPKASQTITVFENFEGRAPDQYVLCYYSEEKIKEVKELRIWNKIDKESYDILLKLVKKFESDILNIYSDERERYHKLFLDYPIQFDKNSLWFVKDKEDGSYIIATLNVNKGMLYVLEMYY